MFGADKKYLTISINDGVIKLAQATSSGNLERIARGSFTATPGGMKRPRHLNLYWSLLTARPPVICVIPANAATAKNIEVPSTDPEEIKSIINLQASRHTPYSREEVLISYINLGMNASNNTRLLLVIVHRDMVKERISILEKCGLECGQDPFCAGSPGAFLCQSAEFKKRSAAYRDH